MEQKDFFSKKEYYKDFYFIYVLTGANYIRPLIKYLPNIPDGTNIVVLTNTPKILQTIKPTNFNLIVADLEKYRDDWSRENEKVLDIEDEQAYMEEYRRMYYEEKYRYPPAIMRFGMNWAIQNNVKKFIIIDIGCKIGWPGEYNIIDFAFQTLDKLYKNHNVIFGHTVTHLNDMLLGQIQPNTEWKSPYGDVFKKHAPDYSWESYPKYILSYNWYWDEEQKDFIYKINDKEIGIDFDGYCLGFLAKDISVIKKGFDLWCDIIKAGYETGSINPKPENKVFVETDFAYGYLAAFLSKYYNTVISPHFTIIRHFYHPENDWVINKIRHLELQPAKSRTEYLRINKEKILPITGEAIAKIIIDGIEDVL